MEAMKTRTIELVGLLSVILALGIIVGAAFIAGLLAGLFTLAGIMLLGGVGLMWVGAVREAQAKENGVHAKGGQLRAAA